MAFDIADGVLMDKPEIAEYLKSIGVTDIRGRLANDL